MKKCIIESLSRFSAVAMLLLAAGCGGGHDQNSTEVYAAAGRSSATPAAGGPINLIDDRGGSRSREEDVTSTPEVPSAQELQAQAAQLQARLQNRRKTLTENRPLTEAERVRTALQSRYDAMREKAMALEAEMNSSTDKQRTAAMDQMRTMKGEMARCQNDLNRAKAATKAADDRRAAAIANDPDVMALERELAGVRSGLQNAR